MIHSVYLVTRSQVHVYLLLLHRAESETCAGKDVRDFSGPDSSHMEDPVDNALLELEVTALLGADSAEILVTTRPHFVQVAVSDSFELTGRRYSNKTH